MRIVLIHIQSRNLMSLRHRRVPLVAAEVKSWSTDTVRNRHGAQHFGSCTSTLIMMFVRLQRAIYLLVKEQARQFTGAMARRIRIPTCDSSSASEGPESSFFGQSRVVTPPRRPTLTTNERSSVYKSIRRSESCERYHESHLPKYALNIANIKVD